MPQIKEENKCAKLDGDSIVLGTVNTHYTNQLMHNSVCQSDSGSFANIKHD